MVPCLNPPASSCPALSSAVIAEGVLCEEFPEQWRLVQLMCAFSCLSNEGTRQIAAALEGTLGEHDPHTGISPWHRFQSPTTQHHALVISSDSWVAVCFGWASGDPVETLIENAGHFGGFSTAHHSFVGVPDPMRTSLSSPLNVGIEGGKRARIFSSLCDALFASEGSTESLWAQVHEYLETLEAPHTHKKALFFTGHGDAGSLAVLAACASQSQPSFSDSWTLGGIISFGSLCPGNQAFAQSITQLGLPWLPIYSLGDLGVHSPPMPRQWIVGPSGNVYGDVGAVDFPAEHLCAQKTRRLLLGPTLLRWLPAHYLWLLRGSGCRFFTTLHEED